jgi:hypothetical protein
MSFFWLSSNSLIIEPKAHMTVIIDWLDNTRAIELSSSFEIIFRP